MILKTGFCGHRKVRSLRTLLMEPLAEAYLIRIWDYAMEVRRWRWPKAEAARTLALAAEFVQEPPEAFLRALRTAGWVDEIGGECVLHDWEQHNRAYLQRVEASKKGVMARQEGRQKRLPTGEPGGVPTDEPTGEPIGKPVGVPGGNRGDDRTVLPVLGIKKSKTSSSPKTPSHPPEVGDGVDGAEREGCREAARRAMSCLVQSGTWGVMQRGPVALAVLEKLAADRGPERLVEEAEWYKGHVGEKYVVCLRVAGDLDKWASIRRQMEEGEGEGKREAAVTAGRPAGPVKAAKW